MLFAVDLQFQLAAVAVLQGVITEEGEGEIAGDGEAGVDHVRGVWNFGNLGLAGEIAGQGKTDAVGGQVAEKGADPEICPFTSCHISLSTHRLQNLSVCSGDRAGP